MKPWKRVEPTKVHKVGWRTIVTKYFELPDGQTGEFDTIGEEDQHFAGVIALTADRKVIVARQFRAGPERIMDELPGGGVEHGEDPAAAAARELFEETGYQAGSLELLGTTHKDAYMNGMWHYFLATDCTHISTQSLDEVEFIDVELISIDEFIKNSRNGLVGDAVAVLLAYEKLKEFQEQ